MKLWFGVVRANFAELPYRLFFVVCSRVPQFDTKVMLMVRAEHLVRGPYAPCDVDYKVVFDEHKFPYLPATATNLPSTHA